MIRNKLKWLPALAWMSLIFMLSQQPGGESGTLARDILNALASVGLDLPGWMGWDVAVIFIRKGAHFGEYFILMLLLWWALGNARSGRIGIALGVTVLYAASDEFHQVFIPGRVGSFLDVLVDSAGAASAACLLWIRWKKKGTSSVPASPSGSL